MNEIIESLNRIKTKAEGYMPLITSDIDMIIESGSKDIKRIENLLDILLNYGFMGVGKDEFDRLNNYYKTFDEEAYDDWKRIYEEFLGDDDENRIISE